MWSFYLFTITHLVVYSLAINFNFVHSSQCPYSSFSAIPYRRVTSECEHIQHCILVSLLSTMLNTNSIYYAVSALLTNNKRCVFHRAENSKNVFSNAYENVIVFLCPFILSVLYFQFDFIPFLFVFQIFFHILMTSYRHILSRFSGTENDWELTN